MSCSYFITYVLRTNSNAIFHSITARHTIYRSKYLTRCDIRKTLSSFFISTNDFSRTQKRFYKTLEDGSSLILKSRFPCHVSYYDYHTSHIRNVDKNNIKDEETKETDGKPSGADAEATSEKSLTRLQKFKLMYKQYWYVLIPVHLVTSLVWYGSFFFAAKSGVDIVPLLEKLGTTEQFLKYLRDSNAGYYGIAYAMYKIATPARYTVTLGGTTLAINYLKGRGYIKPVPTKKELKVMYEDKKDEFMEKTVEMRGRYQERRNQFLDRYHDKRDEMRKSFYERRKKFFDKYGISKRMRLRRMKRRRKNGE